MTVIERIVEYVSHNPRQQPETESDYLDWDSLAVTAIVLGLAPLLHWHLRRAKITIPPLAMAKLAVTHQAHAKRNEAIARQLSELLAAFAARQIKVVVLKGALLAPTVYPEPALRPMNDIDLLFQPDDLAGAGAVLTELGYMGKYKSAEQGPGITKHLSTYRRTGAEGATPNPYLSPDGDRTVEPHGSLEESWFGLKVDITPGIWERLVPVELHRQPAYRLSEVDAILHLTVHAVFHVIMGAPVFVQLYDIGQVLRHRQMQLDWRRLVARAEKAQAQPFVYAGLYWAQMLYGVALPQEPLAALGQACRPDLLAYIHRLDAPALLHRTQQPPLTSLKQRLVRGILDRRESARWAASLNDKWKVWQTALAFHKTDTLDLLRQRLRLLM